MSIHSEAIGGGYLSRMCVWQLSRSTVNKSLTASGDIRQCTLMFKCHLLFSASVLAFDTYLSRELGLAFTCGPAPLPLQTAHVIAITWLWCPKCSMGCLVRRTVL